MVLLLKVGQILQRMLDRLVFFNGFMGDFFLDPLGERW